MAKGRWGWSPHIQGSRTLIAVETECGQLRKVNAKLLEALTALERDPYLRGHAVNDPGWRKLLTAARTAIAEATGGSL